MTGTVVRMMMMMMMIVTTIVVVVAIVAFHHGGPCVTHVVQELNGQFHLPWILVVGIVVVVTPPLDKSVRKPMKRTHMKYNMKDE